MKFVYFIKPIGMDGPIKIGCSSDPEIRRGALAAWSPFDLEVVATIEGGRLLEERFHAKFFRLHQRLEWFNWSPELQEVIDGIRAGTFDIEALPRASGPIKGLAQRAATWVDIDYDYYLLWRSYCDREVFSWPGFTVPNGAVFSALSPLRKQVVFEQVRHFMATYRPTAKGSVAA